MKHRKDTTHRTKVRLTFAMLFVAFVVGVVLSVQVNSVFSILAIVSILLSALVEYEEPCND